MVPEGLIGYATAFHEKGKDVEFIVKKIAKEKFTDKDRMYLVCDTFASEAVVKAAYKMKKAVSGLILIEPELSDKTAGLVPRFGYDVMTIDTAGKASAKTAAIDYLELRGALK